MKSNNSPLDIARTLGFSIINSKEFEMLKKQEALLINDKESMDAREKYNEAKQEYDKLVKNINTILDYITNDNWRESKCNCGGCKKG